MSSVIEKTHPDLVLRPPTRYEEISNGMDDTDDTDGLVDLIQDFSVTTHNTTPEEPSASRSSNTSNQTTSLNTLPSAILIKILRHLLVFDGNLVHAISRLDPFVEPEISPVNSSGRIALLHRFHIGTKPVNVTYATKPEVLLAPLLVSQRMHFLGANIFYGMNKFAFSSLGE